MKVLRALLEIVLIGLAAVAIWRFVVIPYQCNVVAKRAEGFTVTILDQIGEHKEGAAAAANLERITHCLKTNPRNVNLYMLRAANLRILRRNAEAIDTYQKALQVDRRPELYFSLGEVQYESDLRNAAIDSFSWAVAYNPTLIDEVPFEVRERVKSVSSRILPSQ